MHTLGPECRLAPAPNIPKEDGLPQLLAQFFYASTIPIDESTSISSLRSHGDSKLVRHQMRPFSPGDNNALAKAWSTFASIDDSTTPMSLDTPSRKIVEGSQKVGKQTLSSSSEEHLSGLQVPRGSEGLPEEHGEDSPRTATRGNVLDHAAPNDRFCPEPKTSKYGQGTALTISPHSIHVPTGGAGRSSSPFLGDKTLRSKQESCAKFLQTDTARPQKQAPASLTDTSATSRVPTHAHQIPPNRNSVKKDMNTLEVVVGTSRLHKVSLPSLHMEPIYWSPLNDIAIVMRATWFYRDTMIPVAPPVANQLEAGYQDLRPWTETWRDELRCAIEVGPAGEEKIAHCLWPQDSKHFSVQSGLELDTDVSANLFTSMLSLRGEAAAQGAQISNMELSPPRPERANRAFSNYDVIYKDDRQAFLLKPALKPSAYYGRRPVSKIAKGLTIGVPVIRGFDSEIWKRKNEPGPSTPRIRNTAAALTASPAVFENQSAPICEACEAEKRRGQVTDLVLVAHGIGQKIAERVESFHFTHAINGFRRAVNQEMGNPVLQQVLRENQHGVMILPLNWRMGISFVDDDLKGRQENGGRRHEAFGLKDIEPDTIPAVRSMISDVMFDIPFYMSHHKNKMISALVTEANRVYRLWCRNNKGFSNKGRVHLIAHSLGSVMAVDILSRQPTTLPERDFHRTEPDFEFFEFNTVNLFLLGSPAAFFLLLEHASLAPRRGRCKPDCDSHDVTDSRIVGDTGEFGCLAVDNVYNVLAREDPIAYLLNGAVDPAYAAALSRAYVPSTHTSFFKSLGDTARQFLPALSSTTESSSVNPPRPHSLRIPSQMELEVHDFTREEIAEKKAFLLNDNGQIDYFLRSGSGPLELQYLNMLSAHTSYWYNQDFIHMLCMEIGRQPGRTHSFPSMKASKIKKHLPAR